MSARSDHCSTYGPNYVLPPGTSWIELAAHEPVVDGAINIICTRLGLSFDSRAKWLAMPTDRGEWRRADTYARIGFIKEWLMLECNAAGERAIKLVEIERFSTVGD
jgi:hypothetical protein